MFFKRKASSASRNSARFSSRHESTASNITKPEPIDEEEKPIVDDDAEKVGETAETENKNVEKLKKKSFFSRKKTSFLKRASAVYEKGPVESGTMKHPSGEMVYKVGKLEKQGYYFKTWHSRFFVLTTSGISYYESKKKYKNGSTPYGKISFEDVQTEGGEVVHDVPEQMDKILLLKGKKNLFCIHIQSRTYILSSSTEKDKQHWRKIITKAYHNNMAKTMQIEKQARKGSKRSLLINSESLMDLDMHFELSLANMVKQHEIQKLFFAWKAYTDYSKTRTDKEQL
mmetsp:Transcript_31655/g.50559  ORF Transcript_31655/g.50559 Transcript_31655/m.50559 type:complete len:285 (+) Transcript_31655:189-1043(+)